MEHTAAFLVTGASLLMGVLLLAMWRVSRAPGDVRERFLLLAGVAELLFAAQQLPLFFDAPAFDGVIARSAFAALFGLYVGLTIMIANLLTNPPVRWLHRWIKLYLWLVVPASFFIFGVYDFTGYLTAIYTHHKLTTNNLIALVINVALITILVRKFYTLQMNLMQSRLDASFSADRAKLLERQRIMQDIHDTVGSQLVGVLSLIRGGAALPSIEQHTTHALQDLRMAIDALQPVNGNLAAVLASLRHRLQPRLEAANLRLVWQVDDLPRMGELSPQTVGHIQRIVQEALSNIIQHAHATSVTFVARHFADQSCIEVQITDDGIGFDSKQSGGQGLNNLRFRAEAIGAVLTLARLGPCGMTVQLRLPCAAITPPSHSSPNS